MERGGQGSEGVMLFEEQQEKADDLDNLLAALDGAANQYKYNETSLCTVVWCVMARIE